MMTGHYGHAEKYLEQAAELVDTPRIGVARTLAALAQAHATLALVKATRQPQVSTSTVTVRSAEELSATIAEAVRARTGARS